MTDKHFNAILAKNNIARELRDYTKNEPLGMSLDPLSPQGFNQYAGDFDFTPSEQDKLVKLAALPVDVQKAILNRIN